MAGPEALSGELLVDKHAPEMEELYLKTKDKDKLEEDWTEDPDPEIHFTGVTDNNAIDRSNITYALTEEGNTETPEFKECNFETFSSEGPYSGIIRLSEDEKNLKSGRYKVRVRVRDAAGNSVTKTAYYSKDTEDPVGKIKALDQNTGHETDELKGIVTICAEIDGTGSALEKTKISLYKIEGEAETLVKESLCGDISKSQNFEFDTTEYENGSYVMKLPLCDGMGHKVMVSKNFAIENRLNAPKLHVEYSGGGQAKVKCDFGNDESKIKKVFYRIEDGQWEEAESYTEGITIEEEDEGSYKVCVYGADEAGVHTETGQINVICDKTNPQAELLSVERGAVKGKASDANIKKWKLSFRKAQTDDEFENAGISGEENVDGTFGIIDYDELGIKAGKTYELKLTVTDISGNVGSAVVEFTPKDDESSIKEEEAAFRIKRPSYCRSYDENTFTFPARQKSIGIKNVEEEDIPDEVSWYIDNSLVSESQNAEVTLERYLDGEKHDILAFYKEGDKYKYSSKTTINGEVKSLSTEAGKEREIKTEGKIVSFRLESSGSESYRIKIDGEDYEGEYRTVAAGDTVYISDLTDGDMAYADTFRIKSTENSAEGAELRLDTLEEETFDVSWIASFIPESLSVKDRLNGRTYLYWENKAEGHDDISYNVYRSEKKDFTPSEATLAAENVKAWYYSEINVSYDKFYYTITAVKTDEQTGEKEESFPSKIIEGNNLDCDEMTKRLGVADYWQYTSFNTPNGNGYIEESQGNFAYTQEDMTFAGSNLGTAFTRSYNSNSSEKGAFGYGWTHSFDLQLFNVYEEDESDFSNLVFRDGTGTIYRFIKGEDGKYISSQGEYMSLAEEEKTEEVTIKNEKKTIVSNYTLHTNENVSYRFNNGGQLVYINEPNGDFLVFEYQEEIGLLDKVTTNKGVSVALKYYSTNPQEDMLLVEEAEMPDGRIVSYKYDEKGKEKSVLSSVTKKAANGDEIKYKYKYSSGEKPAIDTITDAEGNDYRLKYDEKGRVASAEYPNDEGYDFSYNAGDGLLTETHVETFINRGFILPGETVAATSSRFEANTGCMKSFTDSNGKTASYEYTNGVCTKSSYQIEASAIDGEGNITSTGVSEKERKINIASKLQEKKTVYEDGSYEVYEYADAENELVSSDILYDENGNVVEKNEYEYDDRGNETYDYDEITDRTTVYSYNSAGEVKSMKEYEGEGNGGSLISESSYDISYGDGGIRTETETEIEDGITTSTVTRCDALGRQISEVVSVGGDQESSTTTTYDGFGRIKKETASEDGVTTVTENTYDKNGLLKEAASTSSSEGQTDIIKTSYSYDKVGRQTNLIVNDNGEVTSTATDYAYRDVSVFDTERGRKEYTKVSAVKSTDEDGYISSETYTTVSGLVVREKKDGIYTDNVYDDYGTLTGVYVAGTDSQNENGQLSIYINDSDGRVTDIVTNPEKAGSSYKAGEESIVNSARYDGAGRVIAAKDGKGQETKYEYDSEGELKSVMLPGGQKTSYESREHKSGSVCLNSVTTIDANGNRSETVTDESGNIRSVKDIYEEDGEDKSISTAYSYDSKGRCTKEKEAKGNYKTYTYNNKGYVSEVLFYNGSGQLASECKYTYDMFGNIKKRQDYAVSGGSRTLKESVFMTYDRQGRLKTSSTVMKEDIPTEEDIEKNKISYEYDKNGNITEVDYAFREEGITGLKYTYDKDRRLTKILTKGGLISKTIREYEYDTYGRPIKIKDLYDFSGIGKSMERSYTYDAFGRINSMAYVDQKDDKVKEAYLYSYDKNNSIVKEESASAYMGGEAVARNTRNYTYDANGRLTKAELSTLSGQNTDTEIHQYTYDASGNRTKAVKGGAVTTYSFNGLDQLVSEKTVSSGAVTSDKTYTYDANGNQTKAVDTVTNEIVSMQYNEIDMMSKYD